MTPPSAVDKFGIAALCHSLSPQARGFAGRVGGDPGAKQRRQRRRMGQRRRGAAMATKTHILPGDPPVEVTLKRSARARRISLRVGRADGRVSMSMPLGAPEAEALAFLEARESWLRRHLAAAPGLSMVQIGAALPVEGGLRAIVPGTGRAARLHTDRIEVPIGPHQGAGSATLLKALARDRLSAAADRHAGALGKGYARLTLRDPRTRWGSCSSRGDLMFSWRLVMAPPEILDYVAAHEVAHLAHMDHSAAFWAHLPPALPGDGAASQVAENERPGASGLAIRTMLTNPRPTETGAAVGP